MRALFLLVVVGITPVAEVGAQTSAVSGRVEAEQTAEVLGNVLVYLAGTTLADTTAPDGSFRIDSVPPGQYDLAWYHSILDPAPPVPIRVAPGRDTLLTLRVPLPPVIAAGCQQRGGSAVWGRVVAGESGVPVPGVRVELRPASDVPPDSAGSGGADTGSGGAVRSTRSEANGRYRFCGLSAGDWRVAAGLPGADRLNVDVVLPEDAAVRLDLSPALPQDERGRVAGRATGPGEGTIRIVGTVISDAEGEPVAQALVELGDSIELLTDYRGRFLARDISQRLLPLRVSHAGFDPVEDTVVLHARELVELEVRLGPVTLDPIMVTARRRGILTDVYWRANQGLSGIYLTAEEIEARAPIRTTDAVRSEPGVRVFGSGSGRQGQLELRAGCAPHVYLDGIRITRDRDVLNPGRGFISLGYRTQPWALAESYGAVNLVHPSAIEIIEIYRGASEVPPEFGGSLGVCGAIGIWTRRGGSVRPQE